MSESEPTPPPPPSGEELSPEEMQDIVVVAITRTVPEAIFLSNTLEDAEIPVVSRNDNTQGLTAAAYETRICVPRVLQARAKEIIDKARSASEQGKLDDTFDPETVAESAKDAPQDPLLERMLRLKEAAPETRKTELEAFVLECLKSDVATNDIARYLAAAGLDKYQAEDMLDQVREAHGPKIDAEQSNQDAIGMLMIVGAVVIFFGQFTVFPRSSVPVIILPVGLLVAGVSRLMKTRSN